jgi:hypothetical protein
MFEAGYWPFMASRSVDRWIGSWRNLVPMGFLLSVAAGSALAPRIPYAGRLTRAVLTVYGSVSLVVSVRLASSRRDPRLLVAMPVVFLTTHVIYGAGSICGILDPNVRQRR